MTVSILPINVGKMNGKRRDGKLYEKRKRQIQTALKKLGLTNKTDLDIWLTTSVKHGEHRSTIRLNPNVSDDQFYINLAHELLHYKGVSHNEDTRDIKYSSVDNGKDLLSKTLARMLQRQ